MDCIPYIRDLEVEVNILKDIKKTKNYNAEEINRQIEEKEKLIERCRENLEKLSSNQICYRIYSKMLSGMTPSKAISQVAEENYINDIKPYNETTIWKQYYTKIKKYINPSETPVK